MNALFGADGYDIGVRVEVVTLQSVVPPRGAVQNAFEDVNKAIQDRNRLINEGKEAYNQTIPRRKRKSQTAYRGGGGLQGRAHQPRGG